MRSLMFSNRDGEVVGERRKSLNRLELPKTRWGRAEVWRTSTHAAPNGRDVNVWPNFGPKRYSQTGGRR